MATIYVLGEKPDSARELVSLAKGLGAEVVLVVVGEAGEGLLAAGADRALALEGASERPEAYARAVADLVSSEGEALLLAPSSVTGRELVASVAGMLGCALLSDVSSLEVDGGIARAERSVLGGAVVETWEAALPCVATACSGICEPMALPATTVVETRVAKVDARVERVSLAPAVSGDVDLAKAPTVVCVGMGIDGEDDLALADALAAELGGAVGCTRDVAEGRKLLPKERYIGITGAVVKPALYLSLGVSGQLQHVYGMRESRVVVAVDKNKDAPIFRAADYGIVGDLHVVGPKVLEALRAR